MLMRGGGRGGGACSVDSTDDDGNACSGFATHCFPGDDEAAAAAASADAAEDVAVAASHYGASVGSSTPRLGRELHTSSHVSLSTFDFRLPSQSDKSFINHE